MPLPVELDIAVGVHENRAHFHGEWMAPGVDPMTFVAKVQEFVRVLLAEAEASTRPRVEDQPQPVTQAGDTGSVGSAEEDGAGARPPLPAPSSDAPARKRTKPAPQPVEAVEGETVAARWERMERQRRERAERAVAERAARRGAA